MRLLNTIIFLFCVGLLMPCIAEDNTDPCKECPLPRHPNSKATAKDSILDVNFKDNKPTLYNVLSVKRDVLFKYGKHYQALRLKIQDGNSCRDTLVLLADVDKLSASGLGIGGQTLIVPVYPAREYYLEENKIVFPTKFLELTADAGSGGADESSREIGFANFNWGVNLTYSPVSFMDNKLNLAFSTGINMENSRMRIPLAAEFRFHLFGQKRMETFFNYFPSPCKFAVEGDRPIAPNDPALMEVPTTERTDSTVYFFEDYRIIQPKIRPFLFVKGGWLFDTDFEGAGPNPSLNPRDYAQYTLAAGAGLPILDFLVVKLYYQYSQFNLRTPCVACHETFVVNTNKVHGVYLGFGFIFEH